MVYNIKQYSKSVGDKVLLLVNIYDSLLPLKERLVNKEKELIAYLFTRNPRVNQFKSPYLKRTMEATGMTAKSLYVYRISLKTKGWLSEEATINRKYMELALSVFSNQLLEDTEVSIKLNLTHAASLNAREADNKPL